MGSNNSSSNNNNKCIIMLKMQIGSISNKTRLGIMIMAIYNNNIHSNNMSCCIMRFLIIRNPLDGIFRYPENQRYCMTTMKLPKLKNHGLRTNKEEEVLIRSNPQSNNLSTMNQYQDNHLQKIGVP